jgi:chemotaxis protein MotB
MSRRKRHPAHANHERWLVSYADFITLMFAFFVVMFSSAQVDQRKVGKISRAIQEAFQQLGIFDTSNTRMPLSATEPMPLSKTQLIENVAHTENMQRLVDSSPGTLGTGVQPGGLADLRRELERVLGPEIRRKEVAIEVKREGLVVSLREIGFFDSGSAELRPDSEAAMARIGQALAQLPNNVRVEGHTDNVPIHTARFASNWELSTARATEIVRLFITRFDLPPARLSAGGYAEFHPAAPNDSAEGRTLNRRVDIVVLPDANQPPADSRKDGMPPAFQEKGHGQ